MERMGTPVGTRHGDVLPACRELVRRDSPAATGFGEADQGQWGAGGRPLG
jgi:hypothetical protein